MSEKACPQCKQRYPSEAVRCPRDGHALATVAPSALSQLVGKVIDERYRVQAQLGEGGMGVVFRGIHSFTNRPVAIKVLRAEFASESDAVSRFMQEAQSASRIGHENIIEVYDAGVLPTGEPYFAMELLDGKSLSEVIKNGPMQLERAIDISCQLCRGLSAAHRVGIVHRDIKPENVFLASRDGRELVKILDFGIAKILDRESNLTKAGAILGTPHYMSPEQSSGSVADARSDIYAVGVILYEMICGRPPFTGSTMMAILSKQLLDDPVPPSKARPGGGVWPPLEAIVLRALKKEPAARFQSAEEMEAALRALLGGQEYGPMTVRAGLPQPKQREALSSLGGNGNEIAGLTSAMAVIQAGQQRTLRGTGRPMEEAPADSGMGLNLPLPASLPSGARATIPPGKPQAAVSRQEAKPELPMPTSLGHPPGKLVRPQTAPIETQQPKAAPQEPVRQSPPPVMISSSSAPTAVSPPANPRPQTPPPQPIAQEAPRLQAPPAPAVTPVQNVPQRQPSAPPPQAPAPVASMPIVQPKPKPKDPSGSDFSWGDQVIGAQGDAWGDISSSGNIPAMARPRSASAQDPKQRMLLLGVGGGIGAMVLVILVYMIFFYNPTPETKPTPPVVENKPTPTSVAAPTSLATSNATNPAGVTPDTTKPDVLNPDTTKPDTTKPDKTKPDTTKPDKTKPDTTKPDTTKPDKTKPDTTKPDPKAEAKSFKVMSNPAGAQVFLNGAPIGTTPLSLKEDPSARTVVIKLEGYRPATRTIAANNSSLVIVTLEKIESEGGDPKPELKDPQ